MGEFERRISTAIQKRLERLQKEDVEVRVRRERSAKFKEVWPDIESNIRSVFERASELLIKAKINATISVVRNDLDKNEIRLTLFKHNEKDVCIGFWPEFEYGDLCVSQVRFNEYSVLNSLSDICSFENVSLGSLEKVVTDYLEDTIR